MFSVLENSSRNSYTCTKYCFQSWCTEMFPFLQECLSWDSQQRLCELQGSLVRLRGLRVTRVSSNKWAL